MHLSGDDGVNEPTKSHPLLEIVAPVVTSNVGGIAILKQGECVGARGVVIATDQDLFGHANSGQCLRSRFKPCLLEVNDGRRPMEWPPLGILTLAGFTTAIALG